MEQNMPMSQPKGAAHQQPSDYKTSDLYYAAYLKVAGVPFIEPEREGRRVIFIFENSESIRDLKREYFNRTAKVPALTYADEVKAMKALTHM
jgi:hypothetical protein